MEEDEEEEEKAIGCQINHKRNRMSVRLRQLRNHMDVFKHRDTYEGGSKWPRCPNEIERN